MSISKNRAHFNIYLKNFLNQLLQKLMSSFELNWVSKNMKIDAEYCVIDFIPFVFAKRRKV
jgi:hypothetical protein